MTFFRQIAAVIASVAAVAFFYVAISQPMIASTGPAVLTCLFVWIAFRLWPGFSPERRP